jgi:Uncharacterised protein family (UPF0259)
VTPLTLAQPRDISALFRDSLRVYVRHAGLFILLSAAVVVPVHVVVEGIGLEQLTGPYDSSPTIAEAAVTTVVAFLVVMPIVTAICIHALRPIANGKRPGAVQALVSGFEAFTPLFLAVVIAAIGIAAGFVLLVIPGIYLAVRLFFVPQTVVIDGARGLDALRESSEITRGFWWRTFGLVVMINLAAALPALVITAPFNGIADSSGDAIWALAGTICAESITAPFVALFSTFLYYDLRARRAPAAY